MNYSAAPPATAALESAGLPYALSTPVAYPIGDWRDSSQGQSEATAVGDVTGDGRNDVVMVTLGTRIPPLTIDRKVFVYPQRTDGTLSTPLLYDYSEGLYTLANNFDLVSVALPDLDKDGIKDIVVGYGLGIAVLLADKRGGFISSRHVIPSGYVSHWVKNVAVTDIDRDGNTDVIAHGYWADAAMFFGSGDGGFSEIRRLVSPLASPQGGIDDVALADLGGDGIDDLIVLAGGRPTRKFWIYPNDASRNYGSPRTYALVVDETYGGIAAGDLNSDGRGDVVITVPKNQSNSNYGWPAGVLLFQGIAPYEYVAPKSYAGLDIPGEVISSDLDSDGDQDLLVLHRGWERIGFYRQHNKALEPEALFLSYSATGYNPVSMSVGDINSDTCSDVVLADRNFGLIVMLGKNCVKAPPPISDDSGLKEVM